MFIGSISPMAMMVGVKSAVSMLIFIPLSLRFSISENHGELVCGNDGTGLGKNISGMT